MAARMEGPAPERQAAARDAARSATPASPKRWYPRGMRALAALPLLAATIAGCVVYDPQLVSRDAPRPSIGLRHPPTRPSTADSADVAEITFGLRSVLLDQGGSWSEIGYDLDGLETVSPDFASECTRGGPPNVDGVDGIDNVFGDSLYPLVEAAVPGLQERASSQQEIGHAPALRLRHWNGTPNDPSVEIAIMQLVFATSAEAAGGGPPDVSIVSPSEQTLPDGSALPVPVWDGDDYFWPRSDAFLAGDLEQPFIRDDAAYVRDGVLVGRLPDHVDIVFPTDEYGVLVRLTDAVVTGVLAADGTALDPVVVAGRWAIVDLLSTAENIGICRTDSRYGLLASQIARIADVRSSPPRAGDPIADCDAISIGVTFVGTPGHLVASTPGLGFGELCATTDGGVGADAGVADGG